MSGARRRLDFGERCFGPAEADIVENAAGEDDRILRHDGDARSDLARIGRPHIDAVDEDAARLRIVETLQKGEDGGFAGARGAYQGDCFARRYGEVHRFERGPLRPCRIMEVDLVEGDLAQGWRGQGDGPQGSSDDRLLIEQLGDAFGRTRCELDLAPDLRQLAQGARGQHSIENELAERTRRHGARDNFARAIPQDRRHRAQGQKDDGAGEESARPGTFR